MLLQENVPLAPLTTMGVGGAARFLIAATTAAEVGEALQFAASRRLPWVVMGGGSNLIVADQGWAGLVLRVAIRGVEVSAFLAQVNFDDLLGVIPRAAGVGHEDGLEQTEERDGD